MSARSSWMLLLLLKIVENSSFGCKFLLVSFAFSFFLIHFFFYFLPVSVSCYLLIIFIFFFEGKGFCYSRQPFLVLLLCVSERAGLLRFMRHWWNVNYWMSPTSVIRFASISRGNFLQDASIECQASLEILESVIMLKISDGSGRVCLCCRHLRPIGGQDLSTTSKSTWRILKNPSSLVLIHYSSALTGELFSGIHRPGRRGPERILWNWMMDLTAFVSVWLPNSIYGRYCPWTQSKEP